VELPNPVATGSHRAPAALVHPLDRRFDFDNLLRPVEEQPSLISLIRTLSNQECTSSMLMSGNALVVGFVFEFHSRNQPLKDNEKSKPFKL
jgi:hypothetical protein